MQITVNARTLTAQLSKNIKVVEQRNTIPILGCVRLLLDGAQLKLITTDLDMWVTTRDDVQANKEDTGEFDICLPAAELLALTKSMGNRDIVLVVLPNNLVSFHDIAERVSGEMKCYPPADWPDPKSDDGEVRQESFTNGRWRSIVDKIDLAISTEETRYYLNGMHIMFNDDGMYAEATDGHRLVRVIIDKEPRKPMENSLIVPRKTIALSKVLCEPDVKWFFTYQSARFESGNVVVHSKLIDSIYPDTNRVIPEEGKHSIVINREEWIDTITMARALASGRGRAIKITTNGYEVVMGSNDPDLGHIEVKVKQKASVDNISFGLNSKYISELLKSCDAGDVRVNLQDASSPVRISDGDPNVTRICMPMRV
ncbi:DNA polymerase III subunit beta [uncultured Paraglaciecola sp.]|uniref:DNA polymerase III subunit beta n=1 Tax=uncultured Paraglaciecola sp. TaxID=1765024 RepID=UPI002605D597|nr:DNA polymerase III subunit beta [uncultured Paraglaciecola sp.]